LKQSGYPAPAAEQTLSLGCPGHTGVRHPHGPGGWQHRWHTHPHWGQQAKMELYVPFRSRSSGKAPGSLRRRPWARVSLLAPAAGAEQREPPRQSSSSKSLRLFPTNLL